MGHTVNTMVNTMNWQNSLGPPQKDPKHRRKDRFPWKYHPFTMAMGEPWISFGLLAF